MCLSLIYAVNIDEISKIAPKCNLQQKVRPVAEAKHYMDIRMISGDYDDIKDVTISEAIQSLPLFDNIYFKMQALNLSMVDDFLMDLEKNLLNEYMEIEGTPVQSALFVSALSQLWIFGLYELLRTWRQRIRDILLFIEQLENLSKPDRERRIDEKKREIEKADSFTDGTASIHWRPFELALRNHNYYTSLNNAYDKTEVLFRRIEALRIHLAKHELPKEKGSFARAPGYSRIDMTNGSIYWEVILRGREVDVISRRTIADDCRELIKDRSFAILQKHIQEEVKIIPEFGYGIKRVNLTLNDGTEYKNAFIAWNKEITFVPGFDSLPFNADQVIKVSQGSLSDNDESL